MKPKIWNDITNIFAKWAGSEDYDPRVKYDTSLEYYGNQVPVLPKPRNGDTGKAVIAKADGGYELKNASDQMAVHYTEDTGKTDAQKAQARANIGAVSRSEIGTVFTYKGSVATIEDLPSTGNSVGDVWFVESELGNFVWLIDELNPTGFWDEFGQPIDLSNYLMKPTEVTDLSSTSITLTAAANTYYTYGELTALTISSFSATGTFWIVFVSGATATTVTGIDNFTPETNKRYKVTVENGYATFDAWSVGGGS